MDGFILPDGSLEFEFFVKKNNYQKRLAIEKKKVEEKETQIQALKRQIASVQKDNKALKAQSLSKSDEPNQKIDTRWSKWTFI